jgi:hypothetical protein
MAFTDITSPAKANPDEVATIVAAGHRFEDWESVFVQHRWADAFPWFRFTSAERENDPPSFDWHTLRLKPPDPVMIYLGGQLAMNGLIMSRQTAYEGKSHAVQLEGRGQTVSRLTAIVRQSLAAAKRVRLALDAQAILRRRRHQPSRLMPAKISPGRPAPAMGPGTGLAGETKAMSALVLATPTTLLALIVKRAVTE